MFKRAAYAGVDKITKNALFSKTCIIILLMQNIISDGGQVNGSTLQPFDVGAISNLYHDKIKITNEEQKI